MNAQDDGREARLIPVAELLRSRDMSGVLLLKDEADVGLTPAQPPSATPANINNDEGNSWDRELQRQRRELANAARIALSLTRSFVFYMFPATPLSAEDALQQLSTLQLDDMFVNLEKNSIEGGDISPPNIEGQNNGGLQNDGGMQALTICGIDIISPTRVTSPTQNQEQQDQQSLTPKQVLGKLLYSIFSMDGSSPPSDIFCPEKKQAQNEDEEVDRQQSAKQRAHAETSLFSKLIEEKIFPVSVCRLLADLIDIGPDGKADTPFTSFDEVIQDLEQMISQPMIFLHDTYYPQGAPQPPVFGQVLHGRKEEITKLLTAAVQIEQGNVPQTSTGVESIFVSGIAGSGKSALVQTVMDHLASMGWIVIKAKFERSTEHASRGIISGMFDEMISYLVKKNEGGSHPDTEYVGRVSKCMLEMIGIDALSRLVKFLPSLPLLFDDIVSRGGNSSPTKIEGAELGQWHLIYSLTQILVAVLEPNRFIVICCDDLQWAEKSSLSLLMEILVNICGLERIRRQCLFIGLFREEEVHRNSPFAVQYAQLQTTNCIISMSEIKISSLSKEDVSDMLMEELRLPRRLVVELADKVYKKTSGHSLFVIELLNSFISRSIIAYSSKQQRFAWDSSRLDSIQTGENVAELIASKVSTLPPESQRILHILSCFGMQTDDALLQILDGFHQGIAASIDSFIDLGILDRAGLLVAFTHDLIQQAVYESMSTAQRRMLHIDLGLFLGQASGNDISSLTRGVGQFQLKDKNIHAGRRSRSSLIGIACDEINSAGPEATNDEDQRRKFAEWNLSAGQDISLQSDFASALYYFSQGIEFLGKDCWVLDPKLCLELHTGAVFASFALGEEHDVVARYAQYVIDHASFEDAIEVRQVILRSLTHSGKHEECTSKGLEILRRLDFEIASNPTPESVMTAMSSTDGIASKFSMEQIIALCEKSVDDAEKRVVKSLDATMASCILSSSPFLPLAACGMIQYSFQHGICPESTTAFAMFAMLKIFLAQDYEGARYWADAVLEMENKHRSINNSGVKLLTQATLALHYSVDIWFQSPRDISQKLAAYQHSATRTGQVDFAMLALGCLCQYSVLGGENLSLLQQSYGDRVKLAAKHSIITAHGMAMIGILLPVLTGKPDNYFSVVGGSIRNLDDLQADAGSSENYRVIYEILCHKSIEAFWSGDYVLAEEHSRNASAMVPVSIMPTMLLIYQTFFGGLVAFQLFRQVEANGVQRLKEGKEMMDKMGKWAQISTASMEVFENKWLLLKAEYTAAINERDADDPLGAEQFYQASIKAAGDHGNIHELALAYELLGNYYAVNGGMAKSIVCYNYAYKHYKQWGATAVAEKLLRTHNLNADLDSAVQSPGLQSENPKRSRSPPADSPGPPHLL